MTDIKRPDLFGKLNSVAYKALQSAALFCKMRENPNVELVHWLHQVLEVQDNDLHCILKCFEVSSARLSRDITEALDRLPSGSSSVVGVSSHIDLAVERAWVYCSIMFSEPAVRTGHVIVGILNTPSLRDMLFSFSREFERIKLDTLTDDYHKICAGSPEEITDRPTEGVPEDRPEPARDLGKEIALGKYAVDLTELAREGKIDPIVGRDKEIRQIIDILMRRRQNNPILTGEAGVGKTAVVEGFALRIASGDVPPPMKHVSLRRLDIGLLQAGASLKGEFENRLRQVIQEVQGSKTPIVLFIDEAHTLIGAGGTAGTGDAANLLKPALARGTLRTIAATTSAEYKKYVEPDDALTRRFQEIKIEEPEDDKAMLIMRGVASTMEQHHHVQIFDEAIEACVKLSRRYIPARQLPDKSVSLLDTVCARVAISQQTVPPKVEDCRRRIEALETEKRIIAREHAVGLDTAEREEEVETKLTAELDRLGELEKKWDDEKKLVDEILTLRQELRGHLGSVEGTSSELQQSADEAAKGTSVETGPTHDQELSEEERAERLADLKELQRQLEEIQGEDPLILTNVDENAVAGLVADWTGIPLGRMVRNEIEAVLNLADRLNKRVLGQRHALEMITKRIQTSRAGLENPNRPIGVFLLCGPSGVGKTESALALAEALYGDERNLITINMSEYQQNYDVAGLIGARPGLVGFREGGTLTEPVRRKPYSVVLLDEVEKAHKDVLEIFFQVFDKGVITEAAGLNVDFKNTVILLTSNVGTEIISSLCEDPATIPDAEGLTQAIREPLLKAFPAAFLGRLVEIPYYPLNNELLWSRSICELARRSVPGETGVD